MPELPEVETVRRQLHQKLRGRKIRQVKILKTGREWPRGNRFTRALQGQTVLAVRRRAKLLIWELDNGTFVMGHLKMTGRFVFVGTGLQPDKHDRIVFELEGLPQCLVWSDIRQFGFLKVMNTEQLKQLLSNYGPEPLEVSPQVLADRLKTPKTRHLKAALLNQTVIAGIGNIYADEACHRAGLRPSRRLGDLTSADRLRLAKSIQQVLRESLAQQGTSANDYLDTNGERGGFLELLRVYGREGQPCKNCQAPVKKIVLAQRGTHYCANCQK